MIKEVRRRFRHPWLAVGPEGGSGGHGIRLSSDEVRLLLVRRLQRSAVSRFLTFELDEEDDDAHSFCLALRGRSCSFEVVIGPLISLIDFDWERIWLVTEGYRDHMAHQDLQEEIVYGGPIEGKTPAEVLDLIYEMVCILAEAREVFHDEIRPEEKWDTIDFSEFDDCSYDVYVRDDHSAPYARRFANITFYVNCDARAAEGLGADETGAVASPGEESPPQAPARAQGGVPRPCRGASRRRVGRVGDLPLEDRPRGHTLDRACTRADSGRCGRPFGGEGPLASPARRGQGRQGGRDGAPGRGRHRPILRDVALRAHGPRGPRHLAGDHHVAHVLRLLLARRPRPVGLGQLGRARHV